MNCEQFDNKRKATHIKENTGEYSCSLCHLKFTHQCSLNRHMRTHTGKTPYACTLCDKKFIRSDSLTKHMLTHTGEKPYKCDMCDKKFTVSGSLTAHTV